MSNNALAAQQDRLLWPGIRLMFGGAMIVFPVVFVAFVARYPHLGNDTPVKRLLGLLQISSSRIEELFGIGTVISFLACGFYALLPVIRHGKSWHQQVACVLTLLLAVGTTFATFVIVMALAGF